MGHPQNETVKLRPHDWVLISAPIWPIVWLVVFAGLARLTLGYWPRYNQPDPKDLHWPFLIPPFSLLLIAVVAVLALFGVALGRWFVGRPGWQALLWSIGSFAVLVCWLMLDPAGFVGWWLD